MDDDAKSSVVLSLSREQRRAALGRRGATVWFTGLPAAGKTTLSAALEQSLVPLGHPAYRLDGDELRRDLCQDLGFDREARCENVRRVSHVARLLADAGNIVLVALVSPYRSDRAFAREVHEAIGLPFIEVFVDTPLELCRGRDPKGLYRRAEAGELRGLTGIDDPYEPPTAPELHLPPQAVDRSVEAIVELLRGAGALPSEDVDDAAGL